MIYPTRRLIWAAAAGAPLALIVGALAPAWWLLPVAWVLLLVGLGVADAAAAVNPGTLYLEAPATVCVGAEALLTLRLAEPLPPRAEVAVSTGPRLNIGTGRARLADGITTIAAVARRRGVGAIEALTLRWQGPLGLAWRQRTNAPDRVVLVTPDLAAIRRDSVALLARDARGGANIQIETDSGGEFDALAQYQPGMDRRRIDWKQSARHAALLAKEYRVERDNSIVLAFDCGKTMIEPVDGLARLDRVITAGLLTAYLALKLGDRVSLFAFAARPRLASAPLTGSAAFAELQRLAGQLDYLPEETNYTLGLSTLAARLDRRSLILLFTDFVDAISAELMLRTIGRLLERHVVLAVVLRDDELEALVGAEPQAAADVTRAIVAADLLRERRIVLTRLRRMGVEVLEAPWQGLGPALAERTRALRMRLR